MAGTTSSNVGTLNVVLTASTRAFAKNISGAVRQLGGLKMAVQNAGLAAGASFASFAMVGRGILKAGGDFERGMVRAGAIAQATDDQMKEMRRTALSLSQATEFTARQVADAFGSMAQRGLDVNKIMGASPSVLQLASAAQMGVADAASIATNVLNAYKLEVDDLARVNDSLTAASNNAAIDVRGIGEAFKFVGSVGRSFRVDLDEMVATLGLMGSVGIPAEMAGTSLKKIIPMVSAARNASGKTRKIFDELGLSALSMATNGFPSLAEIVEVVQKRIRDTGDEALVSAQLMEVFGQRAGPALVAMTSVGADALKELTAKIKASGGVAEDISRRQLNTFDGRMKILASQAEALAITFSDDLIPIITKLGGAVSGAIGYFKAMPAATRRAVVEFGAYAAGILGALAATSGLIMVLSPLMSILGAVGRIVSLALTKPMLAAAAAAGGVILMLGAFKQAWDADLGGLKTAWGKFEDFLSSSLSRLDAKFDAWLGKRKQWMADLGETLMEAFGGISRVNIIDPKTGKVSGSEFQQTGKMRSKDLTALGAALAATSGDTGSFKAISGTLDKLMNAIPEKTGAAVAAANVGLAEQTRQDLLSSFQEGLKVLDPVLSKVADLGGGLTSGAMKGLLGEEKFAELNAMLAKAGASVSDFIEALKNGSLGVGEASAKAAKDAAKAGRLISFTVRPMSTSIDSLSDLFGALGSSLKKAMKDFGKAFDFMGRLGIMPSITRDKDGAITGTDPGSLLGGSKVGGILQAGMQGAALGGPLGALAGILAELLMGAEVFQENLEFSGDTLQLVGDALASFGEPMRAVHGQVRILTEKAVKPLSALMESFGKALQGFAPILKLVGYLFEVVAVILEPFADVLGIIGEMLLMVIQAFVVVLRPIILVILAIVRGIVTVWNAIIGAIKWVFDKLAELPVVGKLFGKVAGWFGSLQVSTEGLDNAIKDLSGSIVDDPFGSEFVKGSINEGMEEFGKNLSEVNEELTNVPRGFKVALARFNAIQVAPSSSGGSGGFLSSASDIAGTSIPALASGGVALGPTLALVGERGPEAVMPLDYLAQIMGGGGGRGDIHIGTLTLEANDPFEMAQKLEDVRLRRLQLETGVAAYGGAQYTRG